MFRFPVPETVVGRIRLYSSVMACLPLFFASIALFLFVRAAIIEDEQKSLLEQADSHKVFIEEWFRQRQSDARFLAELDIVQQGNLAACRKEFQRFDASHEDISAVVMVDAQGKTIADSENNIVVDVTDREYFIRARDGRAHVTKVLTGKTSGKPIIIFSHPVTLADGSFGGLVFLASRLTAINNLMSNLRFGATGETYIINRDGDMLTQCRYLDALKSKGQIKHTSIMEIKVAGKVLQAGLAGKQPDGPYSDYRGVRVFGAGQWTKNGTWLIVSERDYDEVMGRLSPFLIALFGGAAVTMVLLTPLLFRLARSIADPLARLSEITLNMTRGNFARSCEGIEFRNAPREVKHLVDAYCAMQAKVDETVQELEKTAVTDQLTGLPNRRHLMEEGARLASISLRTRQPCSLFMLDIDHFKKINDTHGHVVGDTVLRQVAGVLQGIVRQSDIVARYGGEEFAVIAPGSDIDLCRKLAERFRKGIAAHTFNTKDLPLTCTVSIGIAGCSPHIRFGADAYEDMLARADRVLYQAKAAGRNTVRVSH